MVPPEVRYTRFRSSLLRVSRSSSWVWVNRNEKDRQHEEDDRMKIRLRNGDDFLRGP